MEFYLESHLAKKCFQANLVSYLLTIYFVKKFEKRIYFSVDNWTLNTITQNNWSPKALIKGTLNQHQSAKYFMKMDICSAFK